MPRGLGLLLLVLFSIASPAAAAQPQGLLVKLGETWIFHLENGQPAGAHLASPDAKPAPNELMVSVMPSNGTTMVVVNNTDKFLNYRAVMIAGSGHEERTSVCTLMSGGRMGFENWGNAIPAIRLSDFRPGEQDKMVCQ